MRSGLSRASLDKLMRGLPSMCDQLASLAALVGDSVG